MYVVFIEGCFVWKITSNNYHTHACKIILRLDEVITLISLYTYTEMKIINMWYVMGQIKGQSVQISVVFAHFLCYCTHNNCY